MNPLQTIYLKKGVRVELLITPSLKADAVRRGLTAKIDFENAGVTDVFDVYTKLIYISAIHAWEARRYDNPEKGEFPYTYLDFIVWRETEHRRFMEVFRDVAECLSGGKTLEQIVKEQGSEPVKKKA